MSVSDLFTLGVSVLPQQDENIAQIQLLGITKQEFYWKVQVSYYFNMCAYFLAFLTMVSEWIRNKRRVVFQTGTF